MEFIVRVETRLAGKTLAVEEVAKFDRSASGIAPEEIGLSLQEGKDVLKQVQRYVVRTQIRIQSAASSYRNGLRISSAPAESGMSHVINQRMGKRQPMCWTAEGAHLLLQVRCAVLDGRLDSLFRERYPRFRIPSPAVELPGL